MNPTITPSPITIAQSYQRGWEQAQHEYQRQFESPVKKLKPKRNNRHSWAG